MHARTLAGLFGLSLLLGCGRKDDGAAKRPAPSGHERMVALLKDIAGRTDEEHYWIGDREARELRQRLADLPQEAPVEERWLIQARLGVCEGWLGNFEAATRELSAAHALLPKVEGKVSDDYLYQFLMGAGVVWMRLGEVRNCCAKPSEESCILPIRGKGIHTDPEGSRRAIEYFTRMAERFPGRCAPRWLLNIAWMTLGGYPDQVPEKYRLPEKALESEEKFPRFANAASSVGLDTFGLAGGIIVDDFDNDSFLDVVLSSWDPRAQLRFFRNKGDGTLAERSAEAGLTGILGGANLVQTDYNNDGYLDILVLRGTWLDKAGRHPKSLLRNNGNGTFTDVTFESGLGEVHYPTEAAAWADYDNDGDLDLYVGNESGDGLKAPSQLFRNNGNGTFTEVTRAADVENNRFAKGVSWGDYDGDGLPDLYVSNLRGEENRLHHNNGDGTFTDAARELGVTRPLVSYSCWFWDFNNDGHLDLYVPSYQGGIEAVAASYFGAALPEGTELGCLYQGDGKGFREVAAANNLKRPAMSMGANFGDLDNDGFLDFYLGTGYPEYEALMPNVMLRNREGRGFVDVTFAGGFGHLQKGHGIAFADLDNDGDQDIVSQMGGAFRGDGAWTAVYRNPGFGNSFVTVKLIGVKSNRAAIGARIRVDVDDGKPRSIYRHVSSGGSFGANPLRQEIGVGKATVIDVLEITWPTSRTKQVFRKVAVNQMVEITEGKDEVRVVRR